jgi:hypothetical protein
LLKENLGQTRVERYAAHANRSQIGNKRKADETGTRNDKLVKKQKKNGNTQTGKQIPHPKTPTNSEYAGNQKAQPKD